MKRVHAEASAHEISEPTASLGRTPTREAIKMHSLTKESVGPREKRIRGDQTQKLRKEKRRGLRPMTSDTPSAYISVVLDR
jgi:hypothetical protein